MSDSPFFSVVLTVYNKENHLQKTLQSIFDQTYQNFEVIVVNDGSTDRSVEILEANKGKLDILINQSNKGVSFARNRGVKESSGKFISFLDGDDLWHPTHLQLTYELIEKYPNAGLYSLAYQKCIFQTEFTNKYNNIPQDYIGYVPDYFKNSLKTEIAWTSGVTVPRQIFERVGYFSEQLRSGQDTDMWIRIALNFKVAFNNSITVTRTYSDDNMHLSQSEYTDDRLTLANKFITEEEQNNSFKKYMDGYRYSLAIDQKLKGNFLEFQKLKKQISKSNLNWKQRLLLRLSGKKLRFLKKLQKSLMKRKVYLTAFD